MTDLVEEVETISWPWRPPVLLDDDALLAQLEAARPEVQLQGRQVQGRAVKPHRAPAGKVCRCAGLQVDMCAYEQFTGMCEGGAG